GEMVDILSLGACRGRKRHYSHFSQRTKSRGPQPARRWYDSERCIPIGVTARAEARGSFIESSPDALRRESRLRIERGADGVGKEGIFPWPAESWHECRYFTADLERSLSCGHRIDLAPCGLGQYFIDQSIDNAVAGSRDEADGVSAEAVDELGH